MDSEKNLEGLNYMFFKIEGSNRKVWILRCKIYNLAYFLNVFCIVLFRDGLLFLILMCTVNSWDVYYSFFGYL